jgi:hypothetical protein
MQYEKRSWEFDVLDCECGGWLRIVSAIHPPETTRKILDSRACPRALRRSYLRDRNPNSIQLGFEPAPSPRDSFARNLPYPLCVTPKTATPRAETYIKMNYTQLSPRRRLDEWVASSSYRADTTGKRLEIGAQATGSAEVRGL